MMSSILTPTSLVIMTIDLIASIVIRYYFHH
jgi:hypothetical protein